MAKGQGNRRQKNIARMIKESQHGQGHKWQAWKKELKGKQQGDKQ